MPVEQQVRGWKVHDRLLDQRGLHQWLWLRHGSRHLHARHSRLHDHERLHEPSQGVRGWNMRSSEPAGHVPRGPSVGRKWLHSQPNSAVRLRDGRHPRRMRQWVHLLAPQLLHLVCPAKLLHLRQPAIQHLQNRDDHVGRSPRLRIERQPWQRLRSHGRHHVRGRQGLHRRVLQVGPVKPFVGRLWRDTFHAPVCSSVRSFVSPCAPSAHESVACTLP